MTQLHPNKNTEKQKSSCDNHTNKYHVVTLNWTVEWEAMSYLSEQ